MNDAFMALSVELAMSPNIRTGVFLVQKLCVQFWTLPEMSNPPYFNGNLRWRIRFVFVAMVVKQGPSTSPPDIVFQVWR